MKALLGTVVPRREGREKARGDIRYLADRVPKGALYASYVTATISSGRVDRIRLSPGLDSARLVTCLDAPRLTPASAGAQALLLQDPLVFYRGQPIAAVLASTRAGARAAAERVAVRYVDVRSAVVTFDQAAAADHVPDIMRCHEVEALMAKGPAPAKERYPTGGAAGSAFRPADEILLQPADSTRGDVVSALSASATRISQTYATSINQHVPLELHAVIAKWNGEHLHVETATQAVLGVRDALAKAFGIDPALVTVSSGFVGGGFGSKARAWFPSVIAAAMLARIARRAVFLELTRAQTFSAAGCRQPTIQSIAMGCDASGRLLAIRHRATAACSIYGTYSDPHAFLTRSLYACSNVTVTHRLVHLNIVEPISMRAPGEATGSFALESALDELARAASIDPVELRLRNVALTNDPQTGKRWTSNHFDWCLREGARRFGWDRPAAPKAGADGVLRGRGMAAATYPGYQLPATCSAKLTKGGRVEIASATHEIGNGLHTVFAQIAADTMGVRLEDIVFRWGDSQLPASPPTVGSMATASVGPAVEDACRKLGSTIFERLSTDPALPFAGVDASAMRIESGAVVSGVLSLPLSAVSAAWNDLPTAIGSSVPGSQQSGPATQAFGAHFVDISIDTLTGVVKLERIVSAFDVGFALNPMLLRSQLLGGIIFGIGMALMEETVLDPRLGNVLGSSLADYLVPVQADVPRIDVYLCDQPASEEAPFGAKTVGMMGVVGLAAAVGNAIFDATGHRVRETPFTPDRVLHVIESANGTGRFN